jgi:hypothetical protein
LTKERAMALQGGHRFGESMPVVWPYGLYGLTVDQAMDFNEKTRARTPSKDKQTGELVWNVSCLDRDPEARQKEIRVKVLAPVMPVLPEEIVPGSGIRCVEFTGITITPYIEEPRGGLGRARLAYSYRATGVYEQGKAPTGTEPTKTTGSAASSGSSGAAGAKSAPGSDGKAA